MMIEVKLWSSKISCDEEVSFDNFYWYLKDISNLVSKDVLDHINLDRQIRSRYQDPYSSSSLFDYDSRVHDYW